MSEVKKVVVPEFKEKTAEEIEKMTPDQALAYKKEEREYKDALIRKELFEKIENLRAEDAEANKAQIEELEKKDKAIIKQLEEFGVLIKGIIEKGGRINTPNEDSELKQFLQKTGKFEKHDASNETPRFEKVTMKAPALMTTANVVDNVAGGFNQLIGNYIDPEIYSAPKDSVFIMDLIDTASAPNTENLWYVERINEEGDAEFIGEGDLKPLIDGEYQERKADIKEVAEFWKMSNRLINHAPSVVTDFREHAQELIEIKMDGGVLSGDNTGNNLNGITTAASPFVVPTALADSYESANIWDAICAIAVYVKLNNFRGQLTCVLNTVWMAKMKSYKNSEGDYIIPPFVSPDGTNVGSVNVVFANQVPDTHILLGDLKKFKCRISESISYHEGWVGDDFQRNLSSRKMEAFLGTYLPSNHGGAIIYDAIATVLDAIEVNP